MKTKSKVIMFSILLCLLIIPLPSFASDTESLISEQVEQLNLEDLDRFLKEIDQDIEDTISGFSLFKILEEARQGKLEIDFSGFFKAIINSFFKEFLTHTSLLGKLILLGALLAVLEQLQSAFEQNTVAKVAHGIGVLALLTVALSSFVIAMHTGRDAISSMVGFMQSLIPILLTLMAAMGSLTTVALMHPVIYVSLNIIATLIQNIVFPLIFCAAILGIISSLSKGFQITRLADLFRDGSVLLTGLLLTVFTGILGIQGVAGAVTDGVGLRTAKYLTGAVVPVVGGVLTDAVDAVVSCSLFIKNAVGIVGILAVVFICAVPVIKILAAAVMYRVAAALLQPLGARQLSESLHLLGNYLLLVFGAVASVGLMFFIALTIIVGLSNLVVMLR